MASNVGSQFIREFAEHGDEKAMKQAIDADGNYKCTVEEPLDFDSLTLDAEPVQ